MSAVATNTPARPAGVAYSLPLFLRGGISGITTSTASGTVRANLREQATHPAADRLAATSHALDGLTIAVQDETSAYYYAEANWGRKPPDRLRFVACGLRICRCPDRAAYRHHSGAQPVLEYMVKRVRKDWSL